MITNICSYTELGPDILDLVKDTHFSVSIPVRELTSLIHGNERL